jgi:predicted acyl esterase
MGGCLLNENLIWGSTLMALNAQPPDPEVVGAGWRAAWRERLEATRPFPALWLAHPHRDAYWRQGSISEDYGAVNCPVYAIGGWADGYSNAVPRLLANLRGPRKGLVGPWGHTYPHEGRPGPAIGFLQEALAWWDQWLKGATAAHRGDPLYRVWLAEESPTGAVHVAGRWAAEHDWPSPRIEPRTWYLHQGTLAPTPGRERSVQVKSPQNTGSEAGAWCVFGFQGELPEEQREDDARSTCFDSAPLEQRLEILGAPRVELTLTADRAVAFVVVRLNEVGPDTRARRVSYGLLNLTHRDGHAEPAPLVPGRRYRVRVTLNDTAYAFKPGHRIRVAISSAYWPVVWPAPAAVTLGIVTGQSTLELPVRPERPEDADLRTFAPAESAYVDAQTDLLEGTTRRTISHDTATEITRHETVVDLTESGRPALSRIEPIGLTVGSGQKEIFEIAADDPLSARGTIEQRARFSRPGWDVNLASRVAMHATETEFVIDAHLRAEADDRVVLEREWHERIARRLV